MIAAMIYVGGCASNPSSAPPATAAPQPTLITASAGASTVKAKDDVRTAATKRYAREMGYRIETRDGEQLYCRLFKPIGQLIEKKECMSPQIMEDTARDAIQNQNDFERSRVCIGIHCSH
jgi:hypothetical protein